MDRLSRNPTDFLLLQEEMEKHGVRLEFVTETADSSDLGKLVSHVKGYAYKLESEKIKDRTSRGRKETAKEKHTIPGNYLARLYGYSYSRKKVK
jgi:site-specific DNA recombinase